MDNVDKVDILVERPTLWNARTKERHIYLQVTSTTGDFLLPRKKDIRIMGANVRIQLIQLKSITDSLSNLKV